MKYLLILLLLLIGCGAETSKQPIPPQPTISAIPPKPPVPEVVWHKFDQELLTQAEVQKRIIIVYVSIPHCKWCELMKNTTFKDDSVKEKINRRFLLAEVNAEEEPALAATLIEEKLFPSTLFVLSIGVKVPVVLQGYIAPKEFDEVLKIFVDKLDALDL